MEPVTKILFAIVMIPVFIDWLNMLFNFLPDEPVDGFSIVINIPTFNSMFGDPEKFDDIGKKETAKPPPQRKTVITPKRGTRSPVERLRPTKKDEFTGDDDGKQKFEW